MPKHLVVTVHGIRTYGQWAFRLGRLLSEAKQDIETVNYAYDYFSFIAFLVPPFRWLATRRFRTVLGELVNRERWDRVDIVAHSFGTHLIGWALRARPDIKIHTIIFAGSVLRSRFRWDTLIPSRVERLINECGTHDVALIFSQLFVLLTGMAGRVGFSGALSRRFQNRYFNLGHSGYFLGDDFMRTRWVPLLTAEVEIASVDERPPLNALRGIGDTLLNNAEPIKLSMWFGILIGIILWIGGMYLSSDHLARSLEKEIVRANSLLAATQEQLASTLVAVGDSRLEYRSYEAVRYAEAAAKLTKGLKPADLLEAAVKKYPEFNRIVPVGAAVDRQTIDTGSQEYTDTFAIDEAGTLAVGLRSARETHESDKAPEPKTMVLRSTQTGEEKSFRTLESGEEFVAPDVSTTQLIMTRQGSERDLHFRVFDLSAGRLNTPVLEVDHAVTVATTDGKWPFFVLMTNGQVQQFDSAISTPHVSTGRWPRAREISVHPELAAVAVIESDKVAVLTKDTLAQVSSIGVSPGGTYGVIWGPRQDTLLITRGERGSSDPPSVAAIYGAKAVPETLWKSAGKTSQNYVRFVRTRRGSRILVPDLLCYRCSDGVGGADGPPVVRVLDIVWPTLSDNQSAATITVHALSGLKPSNSLLEIHALAASQDGLSAIVSQSTTRLGGLTLDGSQTELWNLSALDVAHSDLAPQSLLVQTGVSVVQRSAIVNDGSRFVLWDTSQIAHVFNNAIDILNQIKPGIAQRSERYLHVDFGRTGRRVYDLTNVVATNWPAPDQQALADNLALDGSKRLLVNNGGVTLTLPNGTMQRFESGLDLRGAVTSGDAWLLYSASDAILFDANMMSPLGRLAHSPELTHLIASLRGRWRGFNTAVQKEVDGSFSLCMRVESSTVECWVLTNAQNDTWTVRNSLFYPLLPYQGDKFISATINRPKGLDVIFIGSRTDTQGRRDLNHQFSALSVSKGTPVANYVFPDVPSNFQGIEWSNVGKNSLTVMGMYNSGSKYSFCTFPVEGGECKKWVPLKSEHPQYVLDGTDGSSLVMAVSNEGRFARLVRPSDGTELWAGELLHKHVIPPLTLEREGWKPKNVDIWRSVSRDVAFGGDPTIFDTVTRLHADDIDVKAIDDMTGQKPDTFPKMTSFQLVRSKLKSLIDRFGELISIH